MTLTTDILLYFPLWDVAENELVKTKKIFNRLVDLYIVACSIGVQADKTITEYEQATQPRTIGRNTIGNMGNQDLADIISFLLQNALINSKTISFDVDERLKLAFDPDYNVKNFSAASFLNGFANYGLQEIYNHLSSSTDLVTVDDLYNYLRTLEYSDYQDLVNSIYLDETQEQKIKESLDELEK